jgi:hypothetical protein
MRSRNFTTFGVALLLMTAGSLLSAQTEKPLIPRSASKNFQPAKKKPSSPHSLEIPPEEPTANLPAGLPLRIQLDHRYRLRAGQPIVGTLIAAVYSGEHVVLPVNTVIEGTISSLDPIKKQARTWALLDGDVTPLKQPVLTFNALILPDGERLTFAANATERTAAVVKMAAAPHKQSLVRKVEAQVEAKKQSVEGVVNSPHKSDMTLKFVYGQLPYHPQEIWTGTQFDAVLVDPLTVPNPKYREQLPWTPPQGHIPPGTLDARLVATISSATDKIGDPVVAVLTQPYFNSSKTSVILPTGTRLLGVVTQARPARKFARNGTLRFAFRQIELPNGKLEHMHGQMTAVEGKKGQNVSVDSEGGAKANSDQGKYLAPLLLGAMAGHSFDGDQGAVEASGYSNGFGVVARIVGFAAATPAVSVGFGAYSFGKSITRRWLMPGNNVVFAKNTRMELAVADR